ncbi:PTS sugar transporter subunit IIC [Amedibacillus hominis]|uniref:Permease IIC component n=1 Tax=Amedibacillus hominis TaxID=2897776 RepID=A0ABS9RCS9_9FIRM|nr:PTS sugar transporter subunit IIC [Amedibacillus hominis]MCH4287461.1 PTS sugar transporter subunit IIC [Amedibacillus hominis]
MEKFTAWMEKHFVPIAAKIGSQRHLVAIRDGFIGIMPVTMAGAIATLLNVFFRDLPNNYLPDLHIADTFSWLIRINGCVWWGTLAMLAIAFSFSFGYTLAKSYDTNPLAGGLVSTAAFITVLSQSASGIAYTLPGVTPDSLSVLQGLGLDVVADAANNAVVLNNVGGWGFLPYAWTNAQGLFTALIVGLISVMIYSKLMIKKVTIKLPEQVPPAVSKAFAAIIPGTAAIYAAGIIQQICTMTTGNGLPELIMEFLQAPFQNLSQGPLTIVIIVFAVQLFWFFGLHGPNVLSPILDGGYIPLLNKNTDIYNVGMDAGKSLSDLIPTMFTWTRGSFDAFIWMGGSGCTIALLIAIFIFSKRDDNRAVAKLSFPMGCFNINEPVIFGLPIVLNPIYFIPWLITPVILALIAYGATAAGLIPPVFITVPWVVPPVIYAILATGGNIMAGVIAAINLVVATLCWIPFVIVANRMDTTQE